MVKTNFLSAKQYKEVSLTICRNDAASFYTSLISMLISKAVLTDSEVSFLCNEENLMLKIHFVKVFLKKFSEEYMSSWIMLNKEEADIEDEDSPKS